MCSGISSIAMYRTLTGNPEKHIITGLAAFIIMVKFIHFRTVMFDINALAVAVVIICALIIGFAKTGVPGFGIVMVPLMAFVFPARSSTGLLLPMLIMGDMVAVAYYRRHGEFKILFKVLPFAMIGIVLGYLAMARLDDLFMKNLIAFIVLILVIFSALREYNVVPDSVIPHHLLFAGVMGILAGFTTMAANAAGPIMVMYLLAMNLSKEEFIGTSAWFFMVVNWIKVPFSWSLGLITVQSLLFNFKFLPFIVLGAILGIAAVRHLSLKQFRFLALLLAGLAAIKLLI
jgi:uncharacterized protein